MPYAPGVSYNPSPIFQGLSGGAADIASAMVAKKEKEDAEKDFLARSRSTESFIKAHAPDLGWTGDQVKELLAPSPDETPRGRYLRLADTVSQGITGATLKAEVQKRQQEQQINDLKLAELKRSIVQGGTDRSALRNAFDPQMAGLATQLAKPDARFSGLDPTATVDDPMAAYTQQGGADPHTLATLAPLARQLIRQNKPAPKLVDFGNGLSGVLDANGNVQLDPRLKVKPPADKIVPLNVGGKNMTLAGSHLLDDKGNLVTAPKPLDPITTQGLYTQYQNKIAEITDSEKPHLFETHGAWEQRVGRLKQDANMLAGQLQQTPPYPNGNAPKQPEKPAPAAKPYAVQNGKIHFQPGTDLLKSVQQALDDGVIDESAARQLLESNGYKRK